MTTDPLTIKENRMTPEELTMTPGEWDAAKAAELAAAAAEHGLTIREVQVARRTGQSLARYAALKRTPRTHGGISVAEISKALAAAEVAR